MSDLDRNVILGVLALRRGLITPEELEAGWAAWRTNPAVPLGQVLQDRGSLSPFGRALAESLATRHLATHRRHGANGLAVLDVTPAELERLDDPEVRPRLGTKVRSDGAEPSRTPHGSKGAQPESPPPGVGTATTRSILDGRVESLQQRLRRRGGGRGGRIPADVERYRLLCQFHTICEAVANGHSRGQVHGGLCPQVIRLHENGAVEVSGWGQGPGPASAGYRSPESRPSPQGDVYGLGALLYHILTGRAPGRPPQRPRALSTRIAPQVEAVCLRALAAQPGDRHPHARALCDDLERALAQASDGARSRDALRTVVGVLMLAVLALAGHSAGLAQSRAEQQHLNEALRADYQQLRLELARMVSEQRRSEQEHFGREQALRAEARDRRAEAAARAQAERRWTRTLIALRDLAVGVCAGRFDEPFGPPLRTDLERDGPLHLEAMCLLDELQLALPRLTRALGSDEAAVVEARAALHAARRRPEPGNFVEIAEVFAEAGRPAEALHVCLEAAAAEPALRGRLETVTTQAAFGLGRPDLAAVIALRRRERESETGSEQLAAARDLVRCAMSETGFERQRWAAEAVVALRRAATLGPLAPETLRDDALLSALHDREDFAALIADLFDRGFPADPFAP